MLLLFLLLVFYLFIYIFNDKNGAKSFFYNFLNDNRIV